MRTWIGAGLAVSMAACGAPSEEEQASPTTPPLAVEINTAISGLAFPTVTGTTNLPDGTVLLESLHPCQDPVHDTAWTSRHPATADGGHDCKCPEGKLLPFLAGPYDERAQDFPRGDPHPEEWVSAGVDPSPAGGSLADREYILGYHVVVTNGRFSTRWSRENHQELFPGGYYLEIALDRYPDEQPQRVRDILGMKYIGGCGVPPAEGCKGGGEVRSLSGPLVHEEQGTDGEEPMTVLAYRRYFDVPPTGTVTPHSMAAPVPDQNAAVGEAG